jgi:uncharacterized protein (TIGR03437 family)
VEPAPADGAVWQEPLMRLPQDALGVRVEPGIQQAEIVYAGAAPGMVGGVEQINFRVPTFTRSDTTVWLYVPLFFAASSFEPFIAVRP